MKLDEILSDPKYYRKYYRSRLESPFSSLIGN